MASRDFRDGPHFDLSQSPVRKRADPRLHFIGGESRSWSELALEVESLEEHHGLLQGPLALEACLDWSSLVWICYCLTHRVPLLLLHPRLPHPVQRRMVLQAGAKSWVRGDATEEIDAPVVDLHPSTQFIIPTSGTSKEPRLVQLSQDNLAAAAHSSASNLPVSEDQRWLLSLPLAHVGGLSVFLRCLSSGASAVVGPFQWKGEAARHLRAWSISHASLVPTQLADFCGALDGWPEPSAALPQLRALLVGGAAASSALRATARRKGLPVLFTYGMTESCAQVATQSPDRLLKAPADDEVDVGRPLEGVHLSVDEHGRLVVEGPQVMLGYLGQAPLHGPFVTSDRGSIDRDGQVVVEGRWDAVIVTGGETVSPEAVESALDPLEGVQRLAVTGTPDARWGERVVGCIVPVRRTQPSAAPQRLELERARQLTDLCRGRVPSFALPRDWIELDELPTLSNGKLDRRALRALVAECVTRSDQMS